MNIYQILVLLIVGFGIFMFGAMNILKFQLENHACVIARVSYTVKSDQYWLAIFITSFGFTTVVYALSKLF